MAVNGGSVQQSMIPVFQGDNYDLWSIKMETLFRSQDLWDLVENGFSETEDDEAKRKENKKKDAKALFFIQQGLHESVFTRISDARTSRVAWNKLKEEYHGSARVRKVRIQSLRREFELLFMQNGETVQEFMTKARTTVNQMKAFGEVISEETIVSKILRSLTPKYDHVVAAIEESKDLEILSFDSLMGSLLALENRINRSSEKGEEKAFQARTSLVNSESRSSNGRGAGRANRGRGRGRGRTWQTETRSCFKCNNVGHLARDCKATDNQAEFAEETEEVEAEEAFLFMAYIEDIHNQEHVWFIDSGCSNHMTGNKSLFKKIDETHQRRIRLGNIEELKLKARVLDQLMLAKARSS